MKTSKIEVYTGSVLDPVSKTSTVYFIVFEEKDKYDATTSSHKEKTLKEKVNSTSKLAKILSEMENVFIEYPKDLRMDYIDENGVRYKLSGLSGFDYNEIQSKLDRVK